MNLYPIAKFSHLDLPKYFPDLLSKNYLQLNDEGAFQDIRSLRDSNCDLFVTIKTDKYIPSCCGIYYFEIRLLLNETLGFIGLGFGGSSLDENQQLGKGLNSVGLYVTNGRTVTLFMAEKEYPIYVNDKTRVQHLGIGINFIDKSVFCTVNGIILLQNIELPQKEKFPIDTLYPAVSSQSPKCSFFVNLGNDLTNQSFSFNFQCFKMKELKAKRVTCLSQEYSPNLAFVSVYNLVSDYLLHHGFAEAWEVLNKYDHSQSKDQSLETIKNRRLIQKCILKQDFLGAINNIKKFFPEFFNLNPIYEFILKCRNFINLIIQKPIVNGATDDQGEFGTSPKSARLDPLLMKHKNSRHMVGYKMQATVAMDVSDDDDGVNENSNAVVCDQVSSDSIEEVMMDTNNVTESITTVKKLSHHSKSRDHLAGEHVMYIIQYGKNLKEEAQIFYNGINSNADYKHGIELLTTAFSLIAYRDPYNSPFKDVLGGTHMEDLAHKINGAINGMLGNTTKARLDSLLDHCLSETQRIAPNSPLLASLHPRLLMSELLSENQ